MFKHIPKLYITKKHIYKRCKKYNIHSKYQTAAEPPRPARPRGDGPVPSRAAPPCISCISWIYLMYVFSSLVYLWSFSWYASGMFVIYVWYFLGICFSMFYGIAIPKKDRIAITLFLPMSQCFI